MSIYDEIFHSDETTKLFSEENTLAQMLRVEAALAQAQAACGLFPAAFADVIASCCAVDLFDIQKIKKAAPAGGNAAIPLVKQLTEIVKKKDPEAAGLVHLGATSQDVVDTATVLQIKELIHWLEAKLYTLEELLIQLTKSHRNTVMAGRTLLQQAKPITFGLKTAGWLEGISRSGDRIAAVKERVLTVQLAGAVGSGNEKINGSVQVQLANILGLKPAHAWHTQRDNLVEFAAVLGILTGSLGKIATDISLLMQTEIGEVLEGAAPGKGISSTIPHKRNPVTCAAIRANAHRVPFLVATMMAGLPQENERSAGLWHAEWPTLSEIALLTGGAVEHTIDLLTHLEIDKTRMLANLELTNGLIYAETVSLALATTMGKAAAHALVEEACNKAVKEGRRLKAVLAEQDLSLSESELDELFKPENSLGNSLEIIDAILKKYDHPS